MRTSFHHQPEAQHPIFQLSTSWQADYPIFRAEADMPQPPVRLDQARMTHSGHRPDRNPAVQRAPAVFYGGASLDRAGTGPTRFRTIQVYPKDWPSVRWQPDRAVIDLFTTEGGRP